MSDDRNLKREDSYLISLDETWEVEYWTETLGVSESELLQAFRRVGNRTGAVREYLKEHKLPLGVG